MNRKHTFNLFAFALISFLSLSGMEEDNDPDTQLIKAAQKGDKEACLFWLRNSATINTQDSDGDTPLIKASKGGHTKVVQFLIPNGANINAQGRIGTALMEASMNGHESTAQFLLDNGADVNAQSKWDDTALDIACHYDQENIVALFLERGFSVDTRDSDGGTLLTIASRNNSEKVVRFLLGKGADVNLQMNCNGNIVPITALTYASQGGNENIAKLLIARRPNTHNLIEALGTACDMNEDHVAQLLLDAGTDINALDHNGLTPLMTAASKGPALQDAVNTRQMQKSRPPFPQKDFTKTVRLLLKRGADIDKQNSEGKTIRDLEMPPKIKKLIEIYDHNIPIAEAFINACYDDEPSYLSQLQPTLLPDTIAQMIKLQGLQQENNSNDNANNNSVEKLD